MKIIKVEIKKSNVDLLCKKESIIILIVAICPLELMCERQPIKYNEQYGLRSTSRSKSVDMEQSRPKKKYGKYEDLESDTSWRKSFFDYCDKCWSYY